MWSRWQIAVVFSLQSDLSGGEHGVLIQTEHSIGGDGVVRQKTTAYHLGVFVRGDVNRLTCSSSATTGARTSASKVHPPDKQPLSSCLLVMQCHFILLHLQQSQLNTQADITPWQQTAASHWWAKPTDRNLQAAERVSLPDEQCSLWFRHLSIYLCKWHWNKYIEGGFQF